MPVAIKSTGGGSVTLTAPSTASDYTLTLPAATATVATTASPTFTGDVTFPGTGVWNSSGNVGIGTTSPAVRLDLGSVVQGTAATGITSSLWKDGAGNYFGSGVSAGQMNYIAGTVSANSHVWYSNATERARIDSSGNFYVSGSGSNTSGTGWAGALTNPVGSISIARNGSNVLAFFHTSNAGGIGGSPVGTVSITTTTTTYSTSSDYRLKNSVVPMTTGLSTVSALKPVTYRWNADNSNGEGFIAHELQAVIPLAVTGEKDAVNEDGNPVHQGVDYSKIVVHLVAAIQELKAELDAAKVEIAALKGNV